jgi:murein DD-endopeptidase MepM/ murein hydrolase activator NlpD
MKRKNLNLLTTFMILIILFLFETSYSYEVKIYHVKSSEGGYDFYGENSYPIECWIKISFPKLENLKLEVNTLFSTSLKSGTKRKLIFRARPVSKRKRYGMRYSYTYMKGNPSRAHHDNTYKYVFPFSHGTKHKLSQGYKGSVTHSGENEYALDFPMDIGTQVIASRDGVVVEVKEDSNIGGMDKKYDKHGNYVLIYHNDGTFANYVHLKQNGSLVKVGDKVVQGQRIGLSGNTGRSSGPHLHFSISKPEFNNKRSSIPVKFLNYDGKAIDPVEGRYYYSTHYEKKGFKVFLGRNISNMQYNNYYKKINFTGKIKFRTRAIDDTILVFFRNGTKSKLSLEANFKLNNLFPSKKIPVKKFVKALSEVYLCFLKPIDNKKGYSLSTYARYKIEN